MKIAITYPPLGGPGVPMLTQNRQFQWFTHPSYLFPIVPAQAATLLARDGHEVLWDDAVAAGVRPTVRGLDVFLLASPP